MKHNNTRGERMPSMLHKGSSCCPGQGEVQHVTQAPYVLSTMFVYQRKNTHMIGSRSMSGLTHSVVCDCGGLVVSAAEATKGQD